MFEGNCWIVLSLSMGLSGRIFNLINDAVGCLSMEMIGRGNVECLTGRRNVRFRIDGNQLWYLLKNYGIVVEMNGSIVLNCGGTERKDSEIG